MLLFYCRIGRQLRLQCDFQRWSHLRLGVGSDLCPLQSSMTFLSLAIAMLKDKAPGSFIVRDSHSFRGAYGLAMKVATPPPSVLHLNKKAGDLSNELVRHFLIECTPKGVRLKGCSNEPYFGSLTALVCQHSITPLALPCKLLIPERGMWWRPQCYLAVCRLFCTAHSMLFSGPTENLTKIIKDSFL